MGETPEGIAPFLRCALPDRLHMVGSVEDPELYRLAADLYLESFPFGSTTALLEAALAGLPVVPAYAPLCALLVANDDAVRDVLPNPSSEEEYLDRAEFLIRHPEARSALGALLRERVLTTHVGQGWLDQLATVYEETDKLVHVPRRIPDSDCATTDADVGLSLWHVMAQDQLAGWPEHSARVSLQHAVNVAKLVGDSAGARRHALRAVRRSPFEWASWRFLIAALLGSAGTFLRRRAVPRAGKAFWLGGGPLIK